MFKYKINMKRNIRLILSTVLIFAALGLFIYVNGFIIPTISASVAIFGIGEVADMIGCHINSVNNYVKRQGLPIRREKGMHPYFLASQVLDWIKQGK